MITIFGTPHGGVSSKQEAGQMSWTNPAGMRERSTLMCKHCQMHFEVDPGSGKTRGMCMSCSGPTCGKQQCMERCLPWEAMIEVMEGSRNLENALEHLRRL